ncbi:hypothetical protein, partial [Streptomyces sp. NPDC048551]|uniref:hypothetical protein n=1 Tax=Streptomyces sp. NPDC048551 TaxID=3155758 RepID=UPI00343C74A2
PVRGDLAQRDRNQPGAEALRGGGPPVPGDRLAVLCGEARRRVRTAVGEPGTADVAAVAAVPC